MGIWVGVGEELRAWSRGAILGPGSHPQFEPLWAWLAQRRARLLDALSGRFILFREWCFAVHSVCYTALPHWFLLAAELEMHVVPVMWKA